MIYLYTYLTLCCFCYYFVYQTIIYHYGSVDSAVDHLKEEIKHEYGNTYYTTLTHNQRKGVFYIVVFVTSPFLVLSGFCR